MRESRERILGDSLYIKISLTELTLDSPIVLINPLTSSNKVFLNVICVTICPTASIKIPFDDTIDKLSNCRLLQFFICNDLTEPE